MNKTRFSVFDGMFRKNAVLAEGMVIAPIVVCCDTLPNAVMLSLVFACITFLTVLLASFYPKKLPYACRIVLYALTASLLYIPVAFLCNFLNLSAGSNAAELAMYVPLLTVNSFIVLHSELYFCRLRRRVMLPVLFFHIAGFCLTAAAVGLIREILAYGTIWGRAVDMPLLLHGFSAPWAGFILLGLLCALHRKCFPRK